MRAVVVFAECFAEMVIATETKIEKLETWEMVEKT